LSVNIQDWQEISEKAYVTSHFKNHGSLQVFNVAYNREARSMRCLIELLKYTYGKVLLIIDIRGSSLTQEDFNRIGEKHLNAMVRIKDIESYRFNL